MAVSVIAQTRELRTAAALFRELPPKFQQRIAKEMRTEHLPMLGREVVKSARLFGVDTDMDVQAFSDQKFFTGLNPGIRIGGKRRFSGGATSADLIRGAEFGANPTLYTRYQTRLYGKGRPVSVTRRATHQFPTIKSKGWVVYPTLREVMPKVAAAWIGLAADMIREAMGAD